MRGTGLVAADSGGTSDPYVMVSVSLPLAKLLLTTHCSLPTTHYSLLTTHHSPRTTNHLPRTTHHAPRTTHHAPRTTHHAPLTTMACRCLLATMAATRPGPPPRRRRSTLSGTRPSTPSMSTTRWRRRTLTRVAAWDCIDLQPGCGAESPPLTARAPPRGAPWGCCPRTLPGEEAPSHSLACCPGLAACRVADSDPIPPPSATQDRCTVSFSVWDHDSLGMNDDLGSGEALPNFTLFLAPTLTPAPAPTLTPTLPQP